MTAALQCHPRGAYRSPVEMGYPRVVYQENQCWQNNEKEKSPNSEMESCLQLYLYPAHF